MPRKKNLQEAPAHEPTPQQPIVKNWADPYRPIVTNASAGFELGEDKRKNLLLFTFAGDPGAKIKSRLKEYGYFYDGKQRSWTVNATPVTREVARGLATEFGSGPALTR